MRRSDLLIVNNTIKEYRPMGWFQRRAYSRRVDHALRCVCPPDRTFRALAETLFWLLAAAFCIGCLIAFPIEFFRWWLA